MKNQKDERKVDFENLHKIRLGFWKTPGYGVAEHLIVNDLIRALVEAYLTKVNEKALEGWFRSFRDV